MAAQFSPHRTQLGERVRGALAIPKKNPSDYAQCPARRSNCASPPTLAEISLARKTQPAEDPSGRLLRGPMVSIVSLVSHVHQPHSALPGMLRISSRRALPPRLSQVGMYLLQVAAFKSPRYLAPARLPARR